MAESPYTLLSKRSFWKTAVAQVSPLSLKEIYKKKWEIKTTWRIATAGSCFAQHISRHLKNIGFSVIDVEPAPKHLPKELHSEFGYSMYSARYGNIYTIRQLLQLAQEAFLDYVPGEIVWEKNGCFYDSLRPSIEPNGLESPEEVRIHRKHHVQKVRRMFIDTDLFIFTLGLTEAWAHKDSGTVFPTVPGSIAGTFSDKKYEFKNFTFSEIYDDFITFKNLLHENQKKGKKSKFILTVSPVPLTATMSGDHVLCATTHSKSVLRSVAGEISKHYSDIDYFPSYEIINNCWSRGIFYESNMRSISPQGVSVAMHSFLSEHREKQGIKAIQVGDRSDNISVIEAMDNTDFEEAACEDALLEEFLT